MGLDNSIEVKRNAYTNSIPELQRFNCDWDEKYNYNFTIVYLRKYYNVRNAILETIPKTVDDGESEPLTIEDIGKIIGCMKQFNGRNWDDWGGSIWTWGEAKGHLRQCIKNLKALRKLMDKYDLEVVFVDSY